MVLIRPRDGVLIPVGREVGERRAAGDGRLTLQVIEDLHELRARRHAAGQKRCAADAGHESGGHAVLDALVRPALGVEVREVLICPDLRSGQLYGGQGAAAAGVDHHAGQRAVGLNAGHAVVPVMAEGGDDARLRPAAAGVGAGAGQNAVVRAGRGRCLDPVAGKRVRGRVAVQHRAAEHVLALRSPDLIPLRLRAGVVHVRECGAAGEHAGADVGDPVLDRRALQTRAAVKQAVGQTLELRREHCAFQPGPPGEGVGLQNVELFDWQPFQRAAAGKRIAVDPVETLGHVHGAQRRAAGKGVGSQRTEPAHPVGVGFKRYLRQGGAVGKGVLTDLEDSIREGHLP